MSSVRVRGQIARPSQRSRLTNNASLLGGVVDGRTAIARRFKDLVSQIVSDQGGADQISEARLQLVRRFGAVACLAEAMESKLANGEQIDINEHAVLCSVLVRLSSRIGIDRRAREIVPRLSEYLRDNYPRHDEPEGAE